MTQNVKSYKSKIMAPQIVLSTDSISSISLSLSIVAHTLIAAPS